MENGWKTDDDCTLFVLEAFGSMFMSGTGTDVVVECADDEQIRAHSSILMFMSPVLRKMLRTMNGVIGMKDFHSQSVKAFLLYLYTGGCSEEDIQSCAMDLLSMAQIYEIPSLQVFMEKEMIAALADDNLLMFLRQARDFDAPLLKEACMKRLIDNFDKFAQTDDFEKIREEDPLLVIDILRRSTSMT
eukprot:TRINITY_DN4962_c0_g1_i2.p1 TRINITY_DN4962_c0_g1~~TRINITY_DN4962_c0_g1_i2.p1  ORF type:complete len:188 (-),score=18.71 TRINITY_DN4962_c0_g1_i2:128-691(-)